jgi:hypothetical protein
VAIKRAFRIVRSTSARDISETSLFGKQKRRERKRKRFFLSHSVWGGAPKVYYPETDVQPDHPPL